MKNILSAVAFATIALGANATQYHNPPNQGTQGVNVNANFTADVKSPLATATGGTATSSSVATGGAAGNLESTIAPVIGGGGSNSLLVGPGAGSTNNKTDIKFERSAPAVGVNSVAPIFSDCRRTINLGASSQGGSGVASGIPLWREGDCQGAQGVQIMTAAGVFSDQDIQTVACTVSVIAETATCKALAKLQGK